MTTETPTPPAIDPMPALHPGMPPSYKVNAVLVIVGKTDKAWRVRLPHGTREAYLPKSTVGVDSRAVLYFVHPGPSNVTMPAWLYNSVRGRLV